MVVLDTIDAGHRGLGTNIGQPRFASIGQDTYLAHDKHGGELGEVRGTRKDFGHDRHCSEGCDGMLSTFPRYLNRLTGLVSS